MNRQSASAICVIAERQGIECRHAYLLLDGPVLVHGRLDLFFVLDIFLNLSLSFQFRLHRNQSRHRSDPFSLTNRRQFQIQLCTYAASAPAAAANCNAFVIGLPRPFRLRVAVY